MSGSAPKAFSEQPNCVIGPFAEAAAMLLAGMNWDTPLRQRGALRSLHDEPRDVAERAHSRRLGVAPETGHQSPLRPWDRVRWLRHRVGVAEAGPLCATTCCAAAPGHRQVPGEVHLPVWGSALQAHRAVGVFRGQQRRRALTHGARDGRGVRVVADEVLHLAVAPGERRRKVGVEIAALVVVAVVLPVRDHGEAGVEHGRTLFPGQRHQVVVLGPLGAGPRPRTGLGVGAGVGPFVDDVRGQAHEPAGDLR